MAVLILLIACINFINLTTAKTRLRMQEMGVRKVIGAGRKQLVWQLVGEALFPALLATMFALLCTVLTLPVLNQLTNREVGIDFLQQHNLFPLFALLGIGAGLLASIYPAVQMTRQNSALEYITENGSSRYRLRNVLVVLQFAITIPLMVASLVIHKQL
ncbi:MAG: FtsX-like permease family protein, partial [Saprospiraceae bacterium]|nr:FtsX-like permease family protein [Saprospiraceae bacterium]